MAVRMASLGVVDRIGVGWASKGRGRSKTLPATLPSVCWAPSAGPRDHRVGMNE